MRNATENTSPLASPLASDLLRAADAAERVANAPDEAAAMRATFEAIAELEQVQINAMQAKMRRCSEVPHAHERLPLRESGDDIGRIESRIPKDVFFHLLRQKNFGWDGLTSDEGQRDLQKAYPVCRVKTVSGRPTVGYRGGRARPAGVNFARGTLNLAT